MSRNRTSNKGGSVLPDPYSLPGARTVKLRAPGPAGHADNMISLSGVRSRSNADEDLRPSRPVGVPVVQLRGNESDVSQRGQPVGG